MKKDLRVGYFRTSLLLGLLSLASVAVLSGQAMAADCNTCHTMPPKDAVAPSFRNITTGAVKGNHQTHMPSSLAPAADCAKCHNNAGSPVTYLNGHAATNNYVIQMSTNLNSSPAPATYGKGAFFNQTSVPNLTNATCSNVNCHFGYTGKPNTTPTWGSAKYAYTSATVNDCNKCHSSAGDGTGSAVGILGGGSHAKHTNTTSLDVSNCINCHSAYTTFQHATSAGQRVVKVQFNAPNIGGGTYSGGNMNYLPGQPGRTFGTCSTTYCHGTPTTLPKWGDPSTMATACEPCHMSTTGAGGLAGAHSIHIGSTVAAPLTGSYANPAADNSTASAYNFSCASCHGNNANVHATGAANANGAAEVMFLYSSAGRKPTYNYALTSLTDTKGFKYSNGGGSSSCNVTYCHSNGRGAGVANNGVAITWTTAAANNCNVCHGNEANATALSGAHNAHVVNSLAANGTTTDGGVFKCNACHAQTMGADTTNRVIADKSKHVNKMKNYSGLYASKTGYVGGNCTNYCHSDGKGNTRASGLWTSGALLDCGGCHGAAGTGAPSTGNHAKHIAASASCYNCHSTTVDLASTKVVAGGAHINGSVTTIAGGAFKSVSVNFAGTTTCSTITCHGAGSPPVTWGVAGLNCDGCHPLASLSGGATSGHQRHMGLLTAATVNFYNYTANKSTGAETATVKYGFGCATCHPTTVASHINGSIDVVLHSTGGDTTTSALKKKTTATTIGGTIGTGTITCTATYCHGTGVASSGTTPAWNGTFANADRCANCHGNNPTTSAHSAHIVGIHYDDVFSGTSDKLPKADKASNATNAAHGYGRATTINCNICHNSTVTTPNNDKATTCSTATSCHGAGGVIKGNAAIALMQNHVNGKIEVQFANVNIKSKAQVRPGSFSGYTASAAGWARNNNAYKTYTSAYDVSKNKLFGTASFIQATGTCDNVVCHNNKQVQWVPVQPLTCDNCHGRL